MSIDNTIVIINTPGVCTGREYRVLDLGAAENLSYQGEFYYNGVNVECLTQFRSAKVFSNGVDAYHQALKLTKECYECCGMYPEYGTMEIRLDYHFDHYMEHFDKIKSHEETNTVYAPVDMTPESKEEQIIFDTKVYCVIDSSDGSVKSWFDASEYEEAIAFAERFARLNGDGATYIIAESRALVKTTVDVSVKEW